MNTITNWSYDEPTAPGLYLMCYGDVESHDAIKLVRFFEYHGHLRTEDGLRPPDYSTACKWARLLIGSAAREFVE